MNTVLSTALACLLLLNGCGIFESFTRDAATLAGSATRGVRDTLTNPQARALLAGLIDTLVTTAGRGLGAQSITLRDSLLGPRTRALLTELERSLATDLGHLADTLRGDLLGPRTRVLVGALRDDLLGPRSVRLLGAFRNDLLGPHTAALMAALRDTLLGPRTLNSLGAMRNDLLGDSTRVLLERLMDVAVGDGTQRAIDSIVLRSLSRVQGTVTDTGKGLTGNVTTILWTAGGVIAALLVLAGIIFLRSRRYRKMLGVLTYQIHNMPDERAYNELTGQIQDQSKRVGVEGDLRTMLSEQGMLGGESWAKRKGR